MPGRIPCRRAGLPRFPPSVLVRRRTRLASAPSATRPRPAWRYRSAGRSRSIRVAAFESACERRCSRHRRSGARPRAGPRGGPSTRAPRARGSPPSGFPGRVRQRCRTATLVSPVPLFAPWVPVIVVAVHLPETGLILVHQSKAADPLRALPEVEMRDEHARRAAMLGMEGLAVELERDPGFAAGHVFERKVGCVAAIREFDYVFGRRVDTLEERVHGHASPASVELRPFRDAVNVFGHMLGRQLAELIP